jgi:hypothetical protein
MLEPLRIAFVLAGRPSSPNELRRAHWGRRAAEAKVWRQAAFLSATDALRRSGRGDDFPLRQATVELVFVLPAARGDLDNLLAGAKPILDGIARGLGRPGERGPLLHDDGVACLGSITVRWRRGRTAAVEVYVREGDAS